MIRTDCVMVTLTCPGEPCQRILVQGPNLPETPEFIPVSGRNSFCRRVIATGQEIACYVGKAAFAEGCCGFMKAEEMTSFLGIPIRDQSNRTIAALSACSRMPRIWSRRDREALRDVCALISAQGGLISQFEDVVLPSDACP